MAPTTRSGQAEENMSEKEKSSAKGAKRTASIAGLFERQKQLRQKNDDSTTAPDVGSLFPHPKRHKDTTTENNPDYQKFAGRQVHMPYRPELTVKQRLLTSTAKLRQIAR